MRSTDGEELGRLLDGQIAYYRALAGDYESRGLDLPGGDEMTPGAGRIPAHRQRA
jgi:hypothetical protein